MPATSPPDDLRPGFLLGQPFWLAHADTPAQAWALAEHEAEPSDDRTKLASSFRPPVDAEQDGRPDGGQWQRIDRNELVRRALDPTWMHVGLVCGAGLGKTTTLQWLEAALNRESGFLAFYRELEGISDNVEQLVGEFAQRLDIATGIGVAAAADYIRSLRQEGKIILLLDSLDQGDPNPKSPAVKALKNLLAGQWNNCRLWVSGRPYAFRLAGSTLREKHPGATWQFVRVGQLDEPECRQLLETTGRANLVAVGRYPQPHRFDSLGAAGRRLARVPRYGRLMALLPRKRYAELTSEGAALWELYNYVAIDREAATGLLDDGLRAVPSRRLGWRHPTAPPEEAAFREFQVRLAHDILGALAFEMFAQGSQGEKPHPLFRIDHDLTKFLGAVRTRLVKAGAYRDSVENAILPEYFSTDWTALVAMDSHGLKNFIFSADGRDGRLRWTDVSTAAYFAAYWVCRHAGDEEFSHTRRWIVDPLTDENSAFREFWQYTIDLPAEAIDRDRWVKLFSPLYSRPTDAGPAPVRSTELIYRSWERMRGTEAQREFVNDPNRAKLTADPKWLAGFIALVAAKSKLPGDTGKFDMGAPADEDPGWDKDGDEQNNPQHPVQLTAYRLHQFCVTNGEYEIFDPRHQAHRWDEGGHPAATKKKPKADVDCPVVNVSWYDAWCFAQWLGPMEIEGQSYCISLPTEAQWEYACRAGRKTPFTFGAEHDGRSCTPDVCNFDGNNPFPDKTPTAHIPRAEIYRKRTLAVDELGPNLWGFYQMHGNVWEWCTDWFLPGFYLSEKGGMPNPVNDDRASARVLRGGSWDDYARYCRSALRIRIEPDFRYLYYGFRLAAVPCIVGAKSGKTDEA